MILTRRSLLAAAAAAPAAMLGARLAAALTPQQELIEKSRLSFEKLITSIEFGELPGYTVWNLTANYELQACECTVFAAAKNLTDELYVADMSRGLIPGMPRLVQAGVEWKF